MASDDVEIDKELFDSTEKRCDINKEISLLMMKCGNEFKDGSLITLLTNSRIYVLRLELHNHFSYHCGDNQK